MRLTLLVLVVPYVHAHGTLARIFHGDKTKKVKGLVGLLRGRNDESEAPSTVPTSAPIAVESLAPTPVGTVGSQPRCKDGSEGRSSDEREDENDGGTAAEKKTSESKSGKKDAKAPKASPIATDSPTVLDSEARLGSRNDDKGSNEKAKNTKTSLKGSDTDQSARVDTKPGKDKSDNRKDGTGKNQKANKEKGVKESDKGGLLEKVGVLGKILKGEGATVSEPTTSPTSMDLQVDAAATALPSDFPSTPPKLSPSPSDVPSTQPSDAPSTLPSDVPSTLPSDVPSTLPSDMPSMQPSDVPSNQPSSASTFSVNAIASWISCDDTDVCPLNGTLASVTGLNGYWMSYLSAEDNTCTSECSLMVSIAGRKVKGWTCGKTCA